MAQEVSQQNGDATTKVFTTSRFRNGPSQNQGLQRVKWPKIAEIDRESAKSG